MGPSQLGEPKQYGTEGPGEISGVVVQDVLPRDRDPFPAQAAPIPSGQWPPERGRRVKGAMGLLPYLQRPFTVTNSQVPFVSFEVE